MIKQYINGNLVVGQGRKMDIYNPANGKIIESFSSANAAQAAQALEAAQNAFGAWSSLSLKDRESYIRRFSTLLRKEKETIIDLLISETGKPIDVATYDFNMLPDCLEYFIEEAKRMEGDIINDYDNSHLNLIIRKPLGVVLGYLAWNFPLLNLGYKLGPVLASGCTCVLKPSSQTPLASLYIGKIALEAGIPAGVINIISGNSEDLGDVLNTSTIPKMITLIGSSKTGRKLIEQSTSSIKHFSLELGGNAPAIICRSADIRTAAMNICDGKINNAGQVCVAPNRIFVHKDVKEKFLSHVLSYMKTVTLGSGRNSTGRSLGPMISSKAQKHMEELVADALSKGANLLYGGKPKEGEGYFFEPTVLDNVSRDMRVYKEEIFGPIIPILTFDDKDNVADLANDTEYGLAAYLYTSDLREALSLSRAIDAGSVNVNEPFYAYNLPHGGFKESGVGKDCSRYSLNEYYELQRISLKQ